MDCAYNRYNARVATARHHPACPLQDTKDKDWDQVEESSVQEETKDKEDEKEEEEYKQRLLKQFRELVANI